MILPRDGVDGLFSPSNLLSASLYKEGDFPVAARASAGDSGTGFVFAPAAEAVDRRFLSPSAHRESS
jgi:hypothetical protein